MEMQYARISDALLLSSNWSAVEHLKSNVATIRNVKSVIEHLVTQEHQSTDMSTKCKISRAVTYLKNVRRPGPGPPE